MKDSIKFLLKAALIYVTLILAALLITFPIINHAYGQVTQDLTGDWRINTSTNNPNDYPHLQIIKAYNPFTGSRFGPLLSGKAQLPGCGQLIDIKRIEAENRIDLLMKKVEKITDSKYGISVTVYICHNDWYKIYLHTGKNFASRPIYDEVWESIKPKGD